MSEPLLLCTDLDRTLLPNGEADESPQARRRFATVAARSEVVLAYVTGRHRDLVEEAMATYSLPVPDFVIGDVGTTLWEVGEAHAWRRATEWRRHLRSVWQPEAAGALRRLVARMPGVRLQEEEKQGEFKVSFYCELDPALERIEEEIRDSGVEARVIFSHDEKGLGLLDLVPRGAGKLEAVQYLRRSLELPREAVLFAGDSGNDLEVLTSELPAVLVKNADESVRQRARDEARARGREEWLYLARGGLFGMNGNYSAGILEGLVHYHPTALEWIS